MKKQLLTIALLIAPLVSNAAITTYTNEVNYLTAISSYSNITEGFEGWGNSVTSVTSSGLTWTATDNVNTGSGWAKTGSRGVFDSFGSPDTLTVSSAGTLFGAGGWFKSSLSVGTLSFLLDGVLAGSTSIVSSSHSFFGIVDTSGFNSIKMAIGSSHYGADDFTFATSAVPIPAAFMFAPALLGFMGLRRKAKNSVV